MEGVEDLTTDPVEGEEVRIMDPVVEGEEALTMDPVEGEEVRIMDLAEEAVDRNVHERMIRMIKVEGVSVYIGE